MNIVKCKKIYILPYTVGETGVFAGPILASDLMLHAPGLGNVNVLLPSY